MLMSSIKQCFFSLDVPPFFYQVIEKPPFKNIRFLYFFFFFSKISQAIKIVVQNRY